MPGGPNELKKILQMVDLLRIDHFRGLIAYWEIPFKEKTAINGHWIKAPIIQFIKKYNAQISRSPFYC